MIEEYKINVTTGKTHGGAKLSTGFVLAILATSKEGVNYHLVVQTCSALGEPPMADHYEKLNPNGVQLYPYDPETDNAKTESVMLTENFEAELDTWVGNANWVKVVPN